MKLSKSTFWVGLSAAGVLAAYGPVLLELVRDWLHDPNYSHGLLIPFVSGFFVWKKRAEFSRLEPSPSLWGVAGLVGSMVLFLLGSAAAEVFTQRMSFVFSVVSVVVFLGGWRWARALAFPVALLLLAIPLPYVVYYGLTAPLQGIAAHLAIVGLKAVGLPAVAEGNIIHLPEASLEVAEACSGIRSLYAFLAIGAIMAHSIRLPLVGKWLLFLSTIPLSVLGNALRVWGSGMAAYFVGVEATRGMAHELFGVVVFVFSLTVLVLIRRGVHTLWRSEPSPSS